MAGIIKCYNNTCPAHDESEVSYCCKPLTKSDIQNCRDGLIRGDQDPKPDIYYSRILTGVECSCGKYKKRGMAFCYSCYAELPKDLKTGLYKKLADGFGEIYDRAKLYLIKDIW